MKSFRAGRATPTTAGYKAFHPELINRPFRLDDMELQGLLEQATLKLGELNAFGELVPNIGHFIRMHVYKEATVSSKIEGTQTNMEEALLDERAVSTERRDDRREVNNYVKAMEHCLGSMHDRPLSSRMLWRTWLRRWPRISARRCSRIFSARHCPMSGGTRSRRTFSARTSVPLHLEHRNPSKVAGFVLSGPTQTASNGLRDHH